MVRILVEQPWTSGKRYIEAAGLSTDTKPTAGIITGSKFTEVDTGVVSMFDESCGEYFAQGSGNGKTQINGATVTLGSALAYDGTEKTKAVSSVVLNTTTLVADTDYKVKNNKGVYPGTYIMQIIGIGSYTGMIEKEWTIGKGSGSVVASPDTFTLTAGGDAGESTLTVTGDGAVSVASSAKAVATATVDNGVVTITPVEDGSATITVTLAEGELYNGGTDTISVTVEAESSEGDG